MSKVDQLERIRTLFEAHGLRAPPPAEFLVRRVEAGQRWDPLCLMDDPQRSVILDHALDQHRERGYFERILSDLGSHGTVVISNIQETWRSNGELLLTFETDGTAQQLELNVFEEFGVPSAFCDHVDSLLTGYRGDATYIPRHDESVSCYRLIPNPLEYARLRVL